VYAKALQVGFWVVSTIFVALCVWYVFVLYSEPSNLGYAARPTVGADLTSTECLEFDIICVRVTNASKFDFEGLDVFFDSRSERFGLVKAGEFTPYRRVEYTDRDVSATAYSDGRKFIYRGSDTSGTPDLKPGVFTFHYEANFNAPITLGDIASEMTVSVESDGHGI
jgi:hypothetical protein